MEKGLLFILRMHFISVRILPSVYKDTHGLIATDMFRMMRCQQVQRTSSTQAAFRLSPTHICGFRLYDLKVAICFAFYVLFGLHTSSMRTSSALKS